MSNLLYLREHLHCKNYLSDDKCMFSKHLMKSREYANIRSYGQCLFVFLLSGKLEVTLEDKNTIEMQDSKMYSLGYDQSIGIKSIEESTIILLTFDKPKVLCDEFNLLNLKKHLPDEDSPLRVLPIRKQVYDFLNVMQSYLEKKMLCKHLQGIKQSEFFFIMRGFYTKAENAMFFYPLIESRDSFRAQVIEKAKTVETVKELAKACNMTTKTFTRKFKETFNQTPKQWMLARKKQEIKIEVLRTDNFKELQKKVGFSSYAHLNDYCIKQFDKTLKQLREEL